MTRRFSFVSQITVVLFLGALTSCCAPPVSVDDRAVIEAVLAKVMQNSGLAPVGPKPIESAAVLIDGDMGTEPLINEADTAIKNVRRQVSDVDSSTLASFREENETRSRLTEPLVVPGGYHILTDSDFEAIFSAGLGAWERFHANYPNAGGIVSFSRIGRSHDGTEAIVIVSYSFGNVGGTGKAYVCRLADEEWSVVAIVDVWVS